MTFNGLSDFVSALEQKGELQRIKVFADPILEIAEVTDRISKTGGKALLFENNGTGFPLLINAYGSDMRMAMALGINDLELAGSGFDDLFKNLQILPASLYDKLATLPKLLKLGSFLPVITKGNGNCQNVVHNDPDLGIMPVLKCWPFDGGRFITLPLVHTYHPESRKTNVGMYRMQILDRNTTGMHWQRHKTGANHYEAWKKTGKKMPVTVTLGGDPVYTYCATAPLPENVSEYILAGFLRKKRVKLVKCLTNDIYIPSDSDIVIEGYVDPAEELVTEGPFGDHTGFYSLADFYPRFHVTCITHSSGAIYPATIVGIPPQEDACFIKASEKIFLTPMKMAIQPEIIDFHMPVAGVAHNLVIVRINKTYPGQGLKVINSLFGTGQMMFSKYLIVVSSDVDIRNYRFLAEHIFKNTDFETDLVFTRGPLDVLDHSSDSYSFGGKIGVDATVKMKEERQNSKSAAPESKTLSDEDLKNLLNVSLIKSFRTLHTDPGLKILILTVNTTEDQDAVVKISKLIEKHPVNGFFRLILVVDHTVDPNDIFTVAWQVLGNSDPLRDHYLTYSRAIMIDGTVKFYRKGGFPRKWPNIVCSDNETILAVDRKWQSMGFGPAVLSPSLKYNRLMRNGKDEIIS